MSTTPPETPLPSQTSQQSVASDIFQKLDKNHDGKITASELKEGLAILKLPASNDVIEKLMEKLDADKNGEISLQEFHDFSAKRSGELREVFNTMDVDKNSYVDLKEVQDALHGLNLHLDEVKLQNLWKRIDENNDGKISFEEWQRLMLLAPGLQLNDLLRFWSDAQALDFGEGSTVVPTSKWRSAMGYLAAGAVAGAVSRTGTAPLERLKILYQVNTGKSPPLMEGMRTIYNDGGWRGLFRGNFANVLKVAPESGIKFFTYEMLKGFISDDGNKEITSAGRFIAGAGAGVAAHVTTFPLEVIKTRLAAAPSGTYNGIFDTVTKIMKFEGKILPFYQGLSASIMSTIPHSGINMSVYEGLKQVAIQLNGGVDEPGATELLICATAASICGQLVGYPFHVAKARLIMQHKRGVVPYKDSMVPTQDHYKGIMDVFRRVVKHEGPKGLFKGIVPSFLKSVPAHGITFLVYEYFKRTFNIDKKKKHH